MQSPEISIVVCTLNRVNSLIATLKDLVRQDVPAFEIILVDQTKNTASEVEEFVRSHAHCIRYFHVDFRGLPKARNFGWQKANASVVLYVDDDIRCKTSFARRHLEAHASGNWGIVAGGVDEEGLTSTSASRVGKFSLWKAEPTRAFAYQGTKEIDSAIGCNFSVKAEVFHKLGHGFDERLGVGTALYEEADFCLSARAAGYQILFDGKARLTHLPEEKGGCRVDNVDSYVESLCRNRTLIIKKHLKKIYYPTAILTLLRRVLAYTVHYRQLSLVSSGLRGVQQGLNLYQKKKIEPTLEQERAA